MPTDFTLRPACDQDQDFVFSTYESALRPYVEWAWGWDDAFQRSGFWSHHPLGQLRIVQVGGRRAGALHVEEQPTCHYVRTVFLHPEYQRQGIGGRLVMAEILRARGQGKPLHLKVIKANPARRLYLRLGFEVAGEDQATYSMRVA